MKTRMIILLLGLLLIGNGLWAQMESRKSSKPIFTDDAYYWPSMDTIAPAVPIYDKYAREFIFLEDTTQYPDTVRMRIVNK